MAILLLSQQNLSDGLRSLLMCAVSGALMLYISPQLSGSVPFIDPFPFDEQAIGRNSRLQFRLTKNDFPFARFSASGHAGLSLITVALLVAFSICRSFSNNGGSGCGLFYRLRKTPSKFLQTASRQNRLFHSTGRRENLQHQNRQIVCSSTD